MLEVRRRDAPDCFGLDVDRIAGLAHLDPKGDRIRVGAILVQRHWIPAPEAAFFRTRAETMS
jgi:hypothetical protein